MAHQDLFLSAKANSLWRQVGQHTYTHPHLGHRLVCPCLCLYAGWKPSHRLRSQWAQSITMATNIVGQAVAALGSVCRCFFFIFFFWHPLSARVHYRVPSLKSSSRIGQWSHVRSFLLFLKNRHIFRIIKNSKCSYEIRFRRKQNNRERERERGLWYSLILQFALTHLILLTWHTHSRPYTHTNTHTHTHTVVNIKQAAIRVGILKLINWLIQHSSERQ